MCSSIELMLRTTNAIHLEKVSRIRKKCTMERKYQFYLHLLFPRMRNFISQREILPIFFHQLFSQMRYFLSQRKILPILETNFHVLITNFLCWRWFHFKLIKNSFAKCEKSKLWAAFRSKSWTQHKNLFLLKAGHATVS